MKNEYEKLSYKYEKLKERLESLIKENLNLKGKENRLNELEIYALKFTDIEKMNDNLINRFQEKNYECKELLQRIAILEEENSFYKKGKDSKNFKLSENSKNFNYSQKYIESNLSNNFNDREDINSIHEMDRNSKKLNNNVF